MATTEAQAAVMIRAADRFDQVGGDLRQMLTKLMGELEVLRAQWQGAGGRSFDAARLRWSEDVTRLNSALTDTAAAIRASAGHYSATDDAAAGRFTPATSAPITLPL